MTADKIGYVRFPRVAVRMGNSGAVAQRIPIGSVMSAGPRPLLGTPLGRMIQQANEAEAIKLHGPQCFDDGLVICGWPEFHRTASPELAARPIPVAGPFSPPAPDHYMDLLHHLASEVEA